MTGRRTRWSVRAACAAAVAALIALTGCVQIPKPVTGSAPRRPALTAAGYRQLSREAEPIYYRYQQTWNPDQLPQVEGGLALTEDRALAPFFARGGGWIPSRADIKKAHSHPGYKKPLTTWAIWATPRGRYPQTAYVLDKSSNKDDHQVVDIMRRQSAADPWLTEASAYGNFAKLRPKTSAPGVMPPPAGVTAGKLSGAQVLGLVNSLLVSHSKADAAHFQQDKTYKNLLTQVAAGSGKHEVDTVSVLPASQSYTIATDDGGMVTFGQFSVADTTVLSDGWYQSFTGQDKKLMPAKGYSGYTYNYLLDVAIHTSSHGKLSVLEESSVWTGLSGTVDPDA